VFIRKPRAETLRLSVSETRVQSLDCSWRWGVSLGGNAAAGGLIAIASPIGGVGFVGLGLGLDYINGSIWDCPERIRLANSPMVETTNLAKYCRRIVVAPVGFEVGSVSDHIVESWIRQAQGRMTGCDVVLPNELSVDVMELLEYDHLRPPSLKDNSEFDRLARVGYDLQATHLVILEIIEHESSIIAHPKIYDLHTRVLAKDDTTIQSYSVPIRIERGYVDAAKSRWFLSWVLNNTPNAIQFNPYVSTDLTNRKLTGNLKEVDAHVRQRLPNYLSNWEIRSTPSPAAYPKWGFDLNWTYSFATSYFNNSYKFARKDESPEVIYPYSIEVGYLTGVVKGYATAFTPLGGISLYLGTGPVFGALQDDYIEQAYFGSMLLNLGSEYMLPFTDRIYMTIRFDTYMVMGQIVDNQVFELGGWSSAILGLGYFLPEMRRMAIKTFN
jgi:hypothetical protein